MRGPSGPIQEGALARSKARRAVEGCVLAPYVLQGLHTVL